MPKNGIDYYRFMAEECRQQADTALRGADKAKWLKLARDWQVLAVNAERSERPPRFSFRSRTRSLCRA